MTQNLNAYRVTQAYRGASTAVAPLTAVVMLLDGAILYLKKTIEAGEAKRFEESHGHLVRATSILRGLSHHLNFEKGGPLAERLYRTYSSIIMACLSSYGRPDSTQRYHKLIGSLTELRDAWKSVAANPVARSAARSVTR
jgi:flagellar protein FliS